MPKLTDEQKAKLLADLERLESLLQCGQHFVDQLSKEDAEDEEEPDTCSACGGTLDDGDGYDGLCGSCADQEDEESEEETRDDDYLLDL